MPAYELIDTHCHLYLEDFAEDLSSVMSRAEAEGVTKIYMPALDENHFAAMAEAQTLYPDVCRSMIGLHPCYVRDTYKKELDFLERSLSGGKFSAVGEIGLDYYWERTFDEQQMICFREQIRLARAANLPIVIHSRSSIKEVIGVLEEESDPRTRGIFHCFSGSLEEAKQVTDLGFMLGIGGVVTYKNAGLAEVVSRIDLRHVVLETDAPFLTPVPFRGKRNESSYLVHIARKIADVKGTTIEEVAEITTRNAKTIFAEPAM